VDFTIRLNKNNLLHYASSCFVEKNDYLYSAAWKTLVSGTVKLFHEFGGGHPERRH